MSKPQATTEAPQNLAGAIRSVAMEFYGVIRSGPPLARFWAAFSVVLLVSALGLTAWGVKRLAASSDSGRRAAQEKPEDCKELKCTLNALEEQIKKDEALARIRDASVGFGEFEVQLVGLGAGQASVLIELDVTAQLDSAETGRWLKANVEPVRSMVVSDVGTITHLTRADLMTAEGKAVIRDRIRERVAQSLPSGKVKEIFFNKYVLK